MFRGIRSRAYDVPQFQRDTLALIFSRRGVAPAAHGHRVGQPTA